MEGTQIVCKAVIQEQQKKPVGCGAFRDSQQCGQPGCCESKRESGVAKIVEAPNESDPKDPKTVETKEQTEPKSKPKGGVETKSKTKDDSNANAEEPNNEPTPVMAEIACTQCPKNPVAEIACTQCPKNPVQTACEGAECPGKTKRCVSPKMSHVVKTFLKVLRLTIHCIVMNATMTYSTWILISAGLGAGLGYFCFAWKTEGKMGSLVTRRRLIAQNNKSKTGSLKPNAQTLSVQEVIETVY